MALLWHTFLSILEKPSVFGVLSELVLFCAPLWLAVAVGLVIGWSWRPKWAEDRMMMMVRSSEASLAGTQLPGGEIEPVAGGGSSGDDGSCVGTEDLERLRRLVEETDGGPAWVQMMDRALPAMSFRAWRREPKCGPPEYRSRTIFEDSTSEMVRDFFWDDEFRVKLRWDDMLIHHQTLQECPATGTMIVQWVRKFPFFCSDREYIIGRRIWEFEGSYYCVTKGIPYFPVPRTYKARRVDLYYSSWCIRPVESSRADGKKTACEVLLFHHEDMGIPREIAKLGVRQGMWGAVRKIEPGLRAYQKIREASTVLSNCARLAQANTKVPADHPLEQLEPENHHTVGKGLEDNTPNLYKFLMIGGAIIFACTLDRGLLAKAPILAVGRRFAR